MTNLEWIRSLDAEQFAEWFSRELAREHNDRDFGEWCIIRNGIRAKVFRWLDEEHKEEHG